MSANVARNFILFVLLAVLAPSATFAATLRLAPSSANVEEGETFSVAIMVASADQSMNATAGVLNFPTDLLQVVSLSKSGSIIGVWVQDPSFSNSAGTVNFEGVALNPGYIGSNGRILNVALRAVGTGTANLALTGGSVLANDGNGTEILQGTSGSMIQITPAIERPRPTPAPTKEPEVTPEAPAPAPAPIEESKPKTSIEKPFDVRWLWKWADTPVRSVAFVAFLLLILFFLVLDALLLCMRYLGGGGPSARGVKVTHRSFLILNDDVDRYLEELKNLSATRKLSSIEKKFVREMKSDLATAEKDIVREMRRSDSSEN